MKRPSNIDRVIAREFKEGKTVPFLAINYVVDRIAIEGAIRRVMNCRPKRKGNRRGRKDRH